MKRALILVAAAVAGWFLGGPSRSSTNDVSVELVSPPPVTVGRTVVRGTIALKANASSLAGPITKVEFYVDGKLVGTATNLFADPKNLTVY